jgi:hypothetical protein
MSTSKRLPQFGLITKKDAQLKSSLSSNGDRKGASSTSGVSFSFQKKGKAAAAFSESVSSDEEQDDAPNGRGNATSIAKTKVNQDVQRVQLMMAKNAKAEAEHAKAIAEDPNVFDYDAVYDAMKQAEDVQRKKKEMQEDAGDGRKKVRYLSYVTMNNFYNVTKLIITMPNN